jgi:class 3 adenylate cyclase
MPLGSSSLAGEAPSSPGPAETRSAELAQAVQATLRAQALDNERKLAWVRVVALGLATVLDTWFFLDPRGTIGLPTFNGWVPVLAGAWWLASLALLLALRRGWYHDALPVAVPLAEGAAIVSLFFLTTAASEMQADLHKQVTVTAAVCTLFAGTGALRLRRESVLATTAMAGLVFALAARRIDYSGPETAFVLAMIASAGVLGYWLAEIVRRTVEAEAKSVILRRLLPGELATARHDEALALLSRPRAVNATVLVSDIRGFTEFAERRAPEEVMTFLDRLHGDFATAVREQGGTVDKFMGDGMLAVFGLDAAIGANHAAQALRAARSMLEAATRRQTRIGIGIHCGQLMAGCLGSSERMELTVIGDTVNAASRLEGVTKERGVRLAVSADVLAMAGGEAGVWGLREGGEVTLRGRGAAMTVYLGD